MIDKRVLTADYNGIRVGMLVLPVVGYGAMYARSVWPSRFDSPGLVLELLLHSNREGKPLIPTAIVLAGGKRVQIGVRYIRPLPEDEPTEEA